MTTPQNDERAVAREAFVTATTAYVQTHYEWESMTKEQAVEATLRLLVDDIGAAQAFVHAVGLNLDLYDLPHGIARAQEPASSEGGEG